MACYRKINQFPATTAFLMTLMLAVGFTSEEPEAAGNCSDQMVAFSPCLPYVSAPPNNESFAPSSICCGVLSADFNAGNASCLCYLLRQPPILGFPLNSSRLNSLASLCPPTSGGSIWNVSLKTLCSGSTALPPLQAITNPGTSKPSESGNKTDIGHPPPPVMSSRPDPDYTSPQPSTMPAAPQRSPSPPSGIPSAPNQGHRSSSTPNHARHSWDGLHLAVILCAIGIVTTCSRTAFLHQ